MTLLEWGVIIERLDIKKRPLLILTIFYILGVIISGSSLGFLVTTSLILLFSALMAAIAKVCLEYRKVAVCSVIFMALGALLFYVTQYRVSDRFKAWDGVNVKAVCKVQEIQCSEDKSSLTVKITAMTDDNNRTISASKLILYVSGEVRNIRPGDSIATEGQFSFPKGQRNPGGFSYRRYLTSKGIAGTLFTNAGDLKVLSAGSRYSLRYTGFIIRNRIIAIVDTLIPKEQAALLNGMLIGYTDEMENETEKEFRDAGLSHIMAVSGSNVGFIVAPLFFLLRKIGLSRRKTSIILIPVLVLFIYITGFSASVARAVIMAIIVLMGKSLYRDNDTLTLISISMLILLIFNPFLLYDAGFQLSYGATLGIILFYSAIYQLLRKVRIPSFAAALLAVTLSAQIGVLPLSVYSFNRISIISIISNLLVVPVTEAITIIGFLMVIAGSFLNILGRILAAGNILMLSFILKITEISAALPYAAVNIKTPGFLQIVAYYILAVYYLSFRPDGRLFKKKTEAAILVFSILVFTIPQFIPKPFTIYFLDVGQGDSIFIQTDKGQNILIDGGGYTSLKSREKTVGETVILPFLMDIGVKSLDMVVLSHGHDDHMAGLMDVFKNIRVKKLLIPEVYNNEIELNNIKELAHSKNTYIHESKAGEFITVNNNTTIKVLFPDSRFTDITSSLNNTSLVLQLNHKGYKVLFCGDLEEIGEKYLLAEGIDLRSDIIKAGHHGSSTSSSQDFINAVIPSAAVISVGKNNFGHPSPKVLQRLEAIGSKIYRTDESGAVILTFRNRGMNIKRMVTDK